MKTEERKPLKRLSIEPTEAPNPLLAEASAADQGIPVSTSVALALIGWALIYLMS